MTSYGQFNDPQGLPTVTAGNDHHIHTCCPYIPSVPTLQSLAKQNKFKVRIVIAIGGTVGLAEGIIDYTRALLPL